MMNAHVVAWRQHQLDIAKSSAVLWALEDGVVPVWACDLVSIRTLSLYEEAAR